MSLGAIPHWTYITTKTLTRDANGSYLKRKKSTVKVQSMSKTK